MYKKALLIAIFASSALFGGQYATLKDGKTIILHENGTWEEVSVIKSPNAQVGAMVSKDVASSPKALSLAEPVARALMGEWRSKDGSTYYNFRNDGTVSYTLEGDSKSDNYTIQFVDEKDNTISVSIGDASRYGKIVFGGNFRKFKIDKSGKNMLDYTDQITTLTTIQLTKTAEASNVASTTPKSSTPAKESLAPAPKNGFVQ